MRKFYGAFFFLLFSTVSYAQRDYFMGDDLPRLMLNPSFIFMDHARFVSDQGQVTRANAFGGSFTYMEPWNIESDDFRGGGYIRSTVGFGKNGDRNWIPNEGSLGAVAALYLGKHEFGVDWGMMGIYGFASYASWGSEMTLKYRFSRVQAEIFRGGAGAFRGWIVPKFETAAFNGFALIS